MSPFPTIDLSRDQPPHRFRYVAESGDTLIEILIALVIIGISVVAIMGALATSVSSSAEYRSLTTVDTVLRSFADAVKYDTEFEPSPTLYADCASNYQVVDEYPTQAFVGSSITVFATDYASIPNPPASPNWQVVLQPSAPAAPSVTISTFANGPTAVSGNISTTFKLQSGLPGGYIQPGSYTLGFTDGSSSDNALSATALNISPAPGVLNPTSGPAGTAVTVSAAGLLPSTPLSVSVDGIPATINSGSQTDANGTATMNVTVPTQLAPGIPMPSGPQSLVVSDGTFTSTSTYTVSNTMGTPGSAVVPPASPVAGFSVQISSIAYWNNFTSAFETSCGANDHSGIQMITLNATASSGVSDSLQIVVTDPNYGAPPGPTITMTLTSPLPPEPGESIAFTATLNPGALAACGTCYPTGTLSWEFTSTTGISSQPCSTATPLSEVGVTTSSSASCTIPGTQVAAGTYQVTTRYSGDPAYGSASGMGSVTVAQQTPTTGVTVSPANPIANEPMTFIASVTGPVGATQPTGQISWSFGTFPAGAGTPPCSTSTTLAGNPPTASCTIPGSQVLASSYSVTATYSGDNNYLAATGSDSVTPSSISLTNVALVNKPGNTLGKIQPGDSIVVSFSGPIILTTVCSAWTGGGNPTLLDGVIKVKDTDPDSIAISSASCAGGGAFGSLNLASNSNVNNGNVTFSQSTITWTSNAMTNTYQLTITVGPNRTNSGMSTFLGTVLGTTPVYTAGFAIPGSPFQIPGGAF